MNSHPPQRPSCAASWVSLQVTTRADTADPSCALWQHSRHGSHDLTSGICELCGCDNASSRQAHLTPATCSTKATTHAADAVLFSDGAAMKRLRHPRVGWSAFIRQDCTSPPAQVLFSSWVVPGCSGRDYQRVNQHAKPRSGCSNYSAQPS